MIGELLNYLHKMFWLPVVDPSVHYNPVNTIVYATLFAIAVVYVVPKILSRLESLNQPSFYIALVPWVISLSIIRVWRDLEILDSFLFVTPFIYIWGIAAILVFAFLLKKGLNPLKSPVLIIGKLKQQLDSQLKYNVREFDILMFSAGLLATLISLIFLPSATNFSPLIVGLSAFLVSSAVFVMIILFLYNENLDRTLVISLPFIGHLWDASSTFAGVMYGAEEKHVVAEIFIRELGPIGIYGVKILLVLPAIVLIEKNVEENKIYYLGIIGLLGLALGTRNFTTLIFGA